MASMTVCGELVVNTAVRRSPAAATLSEVPSTCAA